MAKNKPRPKQTVDTLAAKLANKLDHIRGAVDIMRARRKRPTRVVDPCAAEQSVYDDATAIWQAAFEITLAAGDIAMAAQMELMTCRMNNP